MNITEISIKRPSLIIVLFSVFTLLGFIGYKNLSYELMPDFNQPVVVIKTVYPGAEPNEVETSVSRKIEDALSNLEGVDYLVTKSLPNASIIIANLKYGSDLDKSMQDTLDRITANPKFLEFVAMRSTYSIIMAIVSAAAYYGFILLVAYNKEFLAQKIGEGYTMSIGVPIGVGVILFTIILTWIYVRRANTEFDAINEALIKEAQK